jgi:hypothetical protein
LLLVSLVLVRIADDRGSDTPNSQAASPPAAYLATKGFLEIAWQAVSPVEYAWVGTDRSGRHPAAVGPLPDKWARFQVGADTGATVLYLESDQPPSLVSLFRYSSLLPSGLPAGDASPVPCSSEVGCNVQRCRRQNKAGECVVIANTAFVVHPVTVVFAQWLVPGVPFAVIEKTGPVTNSASWGLVGKPQ